MCTYNTISSHTDHFEIQEKESGESLLTCKSVSISAIQYLAYNKRMTRIDIRMYKQYSKNSIIHTGINQVQLYIL